MDSRFSSINGIEANKRVDFEVSEVEVNIDRIQSDEEINECLFLLGWDVGEERFGDDVARREGCVDGNIEFKCFCVYIANIDTSFVGEEDGVAFTGRVDTDVVFGVGRMGEERLDDEVVQGACDGFDLGMKKTSATGRNKWG